MANLHTIKAVIFDLDGTIGDTLPLCISAFRQSVEPLIERALSDEEIIATFGPSEEGTIMVLAPNHYEQGVSNYLHYYKAMHGMCPAAFEGIPELLAMLKSREVRIAMVTGKGKYSTDITLKQFDLLPFFEIIETGVKTGPRKAAGISTVLNFFEGIPTKQMIYVGDAPSDIMASRQVGVPVIAAAWASTAEPEKLKALYPDELFYTIEKFAAWLECKLAV